MKQRYCYCLYLIENLLSCIHSKNSNGIRMFLSKKIDKTGREGAGVVWPGGVLTYFRFSLIRIGGLFCHCELKNSAPEAQKRKFSTFEKYTPLPLATGTQVFLPTGMMILTIWRPTH